MYQPRLADTQAAALATGIRRGTIRQWLHRGKLTHHGHDHCGRAIVDLDELGQVRDRRRAACKTDHGSSH